MFRLEASIQDLGISRIGANTAIGPWVPESKIESGFGVYSL